MTTKPLKLLAEDADDIAPVSAALQDAVGQMGDFSYEPKARRFTLALNRFRWETSDEGRGQRVRTAVQIGGVLAAKGHRLKQASVDAVVSLLSVTFEPDEAPGGDLVFTFSGGGALRLTVECVDILMADLTDPWRAAARPSHPEGEEAS